MPFALCLLANVKEDYFPVEELNLISIGFEDRPTAAQPAPVRTRAPLEEVALEQLAKAGPKGRFAGHQRRRGALPLVGMLRPSRKRNSLQQGEAQPAPGVSQYSWSQQVGLSLTPPAQGEQEGS